jgi:hypothetical protein
MMQAAYNEGLGSRWIEIKESRLFQIFLFHENCHSDPSFFFLCRSFHRIFQSHSMHPTRIRSLAVTQPRPFLVPTLIGGAALFGAAVIGVRSAAASGAQFHPLVRALAGLKPDDGESGEWVKGGFRSKMDKSEAAQILGIP